jgi:hypothetical protein
MRTLFSKLALAVTLYASLLLSCAPDIEMPPPPPDNPISSSAQVWSYCVYPDIQRCYSGSYSACPGIGGELRDDCPYGSSNPVQSSSAGELAGNSSSSQAEQGNSSGGTAQEYDYCVFAAEKICLSGSLTLCPPGGELSNACPYNSSNSKQSSSSSVAESSSSYGLTPPQFGSSSSQGIKSSSSSQAVGQADGNVFTDTRDGKKYKFEVATDGKIWMIENLNYSRENTLGYCYGVNINGVNPHRDSTTCDNGYGRIYEWAVAMDDNSPQGLCPNGWHIPSTAEWSSVVGIGAIKMSNGFYIYPGNYDTTKGWKERDTSGFYWTSSGNNYFIIFHYQSDCAGPYNGSCEVKTTYSTTDKFSVRCIADEDVKFNCGTNTYNPSTSFCADNLVYPRCGVKEYKPATQFCSGTTVYSLCGGEKYDPLTEFCSSNSIYTKCGGKEYNPATRECVDGTLYSKTSDYLITCNSRIEDLDCNNMRSVTLQVGECVEIDVMGYNNTGHLSNVVMRCDASYIASALFTVSLNGRSTTFNSLHFDVSLGTIRLGDNEFGRLCVTDLNGATALKCTLGQ